MTVGPPGATTAISEDDREGLNDRVQVGGGASLDWLTAGVGKPELASSPQHSQSP